MTEGRDVSRPPRQVVILRRMIWMMLQMNLCGYERNRTDSRWNILMAMKRAAAA